MTGESFFINNNDLCLMSAAKSSRNNPLPWPCSAEQLPFPWPSFYCCRAGRRKQWSCTCQRDGSAIIPARRNRAMKHRHTPLLAQLLSLELPSCQTNSQSHLPHNCGMDTKSITRDRQTFPRDTK